MQQYTPSIGPREARKVRRAYELAREALGDEIDIIVHCHNELDVPSAIRVAQASKDEGRDASFGYELDDFARAVLEGKNLEAGPEYSLGELRTALAIYRSAESRQWEKVWD
jgi:predicted dehydrogenase